MNRANGNGNSEIPQEWQEYTERGIEEAKAQAEREGAEAGEEGNWHADVGGNVQMELSEKQSEVVQFADVDGDFCFTHGAIRSGKTTACVIAFYNYITHPDRAGHLHLICAQSINVIRRDIFELIRKLAESAGDNWTASFNERGSTIYIGQRRRDNGYLVDTREPHTKIIVCAGADEDTFHRIMGLTIHSVFFDEVVLVPKSFFQNTIGRMTFPDSKGFFSTNPGTPRSWLKTDYLDRGQFEMVRHFTFEDNPFLSDAYKERQRNNFVPGTAHFNRYILGEWVASEGAIFREWSTINLEEALGARWNPQAPSEMFNRVIIGHDHGISDPCIFQPVVQIDGATLRYERIDEETGEVSRHSNRYEYVVLPALRIEEAMSDREILDRFLLWMVDCFGQNVPTTFVRDVAPVAANFNREMRKDRRILRMKMDYRHAYARAFRPEFGTNPDRGLLDSIAHLNTRLISREMVIDEGCTGLLDELDGYEWAPNQRNERPKDGDDHHIDALRGAAKVIGRRTIGRLVRQGA